MNFDVYDRMIEEDHHLYHDDQQMDSFILVRASAGSVYGAYCQALRELYSRRQALRHSYAARQLIAIDIEDYEERAKTHKNEFQRRRYVVKLWRAKEERVELERAIKDTEREFRHFESRAASLKSMLGPIDEERREELRWEMWAKKLKAQYMFEQKARQDQVGVALYESIASLPPEIREKYDLPLVATVPMRSIE